MKEGDLSRRAFLKKSLEAAEVVGAGALLSCFPGTVLQALEFAEGTKWLDGLRKLHDAARFEKNEHAGTFVGDRESGEWVHTAEGVQFGVPGAVAGIARIAHREGRAEQIARGLTFDHTHPESSLKMLAGKYTNQPVDSIDPRVLDFMGLPSGGDIGLATHGTDIVKKYFETAGAPHGSIEWGMVTARGRWSIKKIVWDSASDAKYPDVSKKYQKQEAARSRLYTGIHSMIKEWLLRIPNEVEQIFSGALQDDWRGVARTSEQRADILAFLMLVEGPTLMGKPRIRELRERDDAPWPLISALLSYWRLSSSTLSFELLKGVLIESLLSGTTTPQDAEDEFRKTLLGKAFLDLSWEPRK